VVEHEGYHPSGHVEVRSYGGLDLDAKAQAKEPCHAVVIGPRLWRTGRLPRARPT
jgi:hypothetical protein